MVSGSVISSLDLCIIIIIILSIIRIFTNKKQQEEEQEKERPTATVLIPVHDSDSPKYDLIIGNTLSLNPLHPLHIHYYNIGYWNIHVGGLNSNDHNNHTIVHRHHL